MLRCRDSSQGYNITRVTAKKIYSHNESKLLTKSNRSTDELCRNAMKGTEYFGGVINELVRTKIVMIKL